VSTAIHITATGPSIRKPRLGSTVNMTAWFILTN
jgi:hypothetical protein